MEGKGAIMTVCFQKAYDPEVEQVLRQYYQSLSEKDRRRFAAAEAITLGRGGISYIESILGCSRKTIKAGIQELKQLHNDTTGNVNQATNMSHTSIHQELPELEHIETFSPNALSSLKSFGQKAGVKKPYRIRRPGSGRKLAEQKNPNLVPALERILNNENEIAGDPMSEQKWVRSTLRRLSERLKTEGHQASIPTVRRLLKDMGFSLKANQRKHVRSKNPERDKQFQYIASQRQVFTAAGLPIISVDTKKKELIGDYKNNGRTWCREAEEVYDHDFPDAAECKAVPFGIYDVTRNEGYVVVGTSNNTPEFSVNAIARWWEEEGQAAYPSAGRLLMLADGGGSNGARVRAWKYNLQEKLCDRFGITVTVCHYPTGCSKWNPVEHRLFSQISCNWVGKPLRTLGLMLSYIRGTTTRTGLTVKAYLDDNHYKKGQRVRREDFERLNIRAHTVCPNWNYTMSPKLRLVSGL
jgi:transposase